MSRATVKRRQPATFEVEMAPVARGMPRVTWRCTVSCDGIVAVRDFDRQRVSISWETLLGILAARGLRMRNGGGQ